MKIVKALGVLVIITSFCSPAICLKPLGEIEISPSDHIQGSTKSETVVERRSSNYSRTEIADRKKFAHASGGRGGGGHPAVVSGSDAHGDGSHPKGAAGFIPLYAAGVAGATNRHNNHGKHNGGARGYSSAGLTILVLIASVCLLLRN
ncbi:uncharacterized protein LOC127241425 [Andrographis paniculata]|uniref:uncharacterized protein LOC127241425 n=1 Tax=Andrographis paniculata TaxID=175694 RepID=UPI0021E7D37A|nr:uncharacterized protein LOC127241425 [Andrographis paniculata]